MWQDDGQNISEPAYLVLMGLFGVSGHSRSRNSKGGDQHRGQYQLPATQHGLVLGPGTLTRCFLFCEFSTEHCIFSRTLPSRVVGVAGERRGLRPYELHKQGELKAASILLMRQERSLTAPPG